MKVLVTTVLVMLSACGVNSHINDRSKFKSSAEDEIISAVIGCYSVDRSEITNSAIPSHTSVTKVQTTKKICLEDSLIDGHVSRSGRVLVVARNAENEVVGGTWGFDVSPSQPRCPGCYKFAGFDGIIDWNGGRHLSDENAPIEVTMKINSLQTTFEFSVGQ